MFELLIFTSTPSCIFFLNFGIVRNVKIILSNTEGNKEETKTSIRPTHSGCVEMGMMNIRLKMMEHTYTNIKTSSILSSALTTDLMTDDEKRKLINTELHHQK